MNWGFKDFVDAAVAADSCFHGYSYRQGQEPADLSWYWHRFFISNMGVWNDGPILVRSADLLSGYHIISFISYACAWRRRHQIVFHDWEYLELESVMLLYEIGRAHV